MSRNKKRPARIRALSRELGVGHRGAANIDAKRQACARASNAANANHSGVGNCTECGAPLPAQTEGTS